MDALHIVVLKSTAYRIRHFKLFQLLMRSIGILPYKTVYMLYRLPVLHPLNI